MILLNIEGQHLKCQKPMIVSDTVNFIEVDALFSGEWNGLDKYIHFTQGEQTYDLQFVDDKITADMGLNLTEGYWEVSVHGEIIEGDEVIKRITTNPIDLYVVQSGVINGEPFPTITTSIGEQYVGRMQELLDNAGIDDIKEDITDIKEQIEHGVKVDAYTKAESDAKYQPVGEYATQTELDKKMEYYIVKGENVSGHIVLTKDGVAQTYEMLKSAFDDEKLFLYLVYDYHIYIPSIDLSTGILFNSSSIYRETDGQLYSETDRILVKADSSVESAHTTSELLSNKTSEMPLEAMSGLTDDEKAQYYPSVGAVEQYVGDVSETIRYDDTEIKAEISALPKTVNNIAPDSSGNITIATGTPQEYNTLVSDVSYVKSALSDNTDYYDLTTHFNRTFSETKAGVTMSGDGTGTYTINGTSTANTLHNFIYSETSLPDYFKRGRTYRVKINFEGSTKIAVRVIIFKPDGNDSSFSNIHDASFTIPYNATGICVRLYIFSGNTYNNVKCHLSIFNDDVVEVMTNEIAHTTETRAGVKFTWSGNTCTAVGTVTSGSNAMNNLYYSETQLPSGINPSESYYFTYKTSNPHIHLNVRFWTGHGVTSEYINFGKSVVVPPDAVGMQLRLYVPSDYTVNDTVSDIHVYKSSKKLMPLKLISVVDDDTTNDTYVTRFHDNCLHNGIVGNYACLTYKLENGDTSVDKLLGYEDEGFGMLIHTYWQSGQTDWTDKGTTRNIANCRENLAKGLRQMQEHGFVNYKYWLTPGGNRDTEIEELARYYGLKCLAETNNYDWNPASPISRYSIKRHGYNPDEGESTAITRAKSVIDAFMADEKGGWLVITTHFNAWSSLTYDTTLDSNGYAKGYSGFNEIVEYAKNKGGKFVPFSEGFSFIEPFCVD